MSKAICRMSKCKSSGSATGKTQHNYREREVLNADKEREHLNQEYLNLSHKSIWDVATERIEEAAVKRKIKPDAVRAIEMILSASADFFERDQNGLALDIRENEWLKKNKKFLQERYGKNLVALTLHQDEKTPHLHAIIVPLTEDNRLSAKEVFTPRTLRVLQTDYAKAMECFGLERGIEGSKIKHSDMKTYYGAVKSLNDLQEQTKEARTLKNQLPDLQMQKQFLEQQLRLEREKFEQEKATDKIERQRLEQEMAKLKFNYEFSKAALNKIEKELVEKQKAQNQPFKRTR